MPIERISLSDPFSYEVAKHQNRSSVSSEKRKSTKLPQTISYIKRTVNSESDLAYIRKGVNQHTIPPLPSRFTLFEAKTSDTLTEPAPSLQKSISIGSKTYFMPQMIIGIDPKNFHRPNQSLSPEE